MTLLVAAIAGTAALVGGVFAGILGLTGILLGPLIAVIGFVVLIVSPSI